jgi:hypothetical protein
MPPEIGTVLVGLAVKVPANREPSDTNTRKWRPLCPRANCRACADAEPTATPCPDGVAAKAGTYPFGFLPCVKRLDYTTLPVGPQFVKCARCVRDAEPSVGPFIGSRRIGGCDRDALVSAGDWTLRCDVIVDWDPRPALAPTHKIVDKLP